MSTHLAFRRAASSTRGANDECDSEHDIPDPESRIRQATQLRNAGAKAPAHARWIRGEGDQVHLSRPGRPKLGAHHRDLAAVKEAVVDDVLQHHRERLASWLAVEAAILQRGANAVLTEPWRGRRAGGARVRARRPAAHANRSSRPRRGCGRRSRRPSAPPRRSSSPTGARAFRGSTESCSALDVLAGTDLG